MFIANPENYAPHYSAYCALGVSANKAVSTNAKVWTIVKGQLYLNYNLEFRDVWR
jgi:hypothetical protein